jgi:flagellar protein FliO/FliZ
MTALPQAASPLSVGSLTQLTLSLIAIVAMIFAISWAMKRLKLAGPRGGGGDLAVLEELCVGQRDRILLIRVGDAQVLVGIGASGVVPLTPLATPIALTGAAPSSPFGDRLRELMRRPGGGV